MMEDHALDLLRATVWVLSVSGGLIVLLLGAIVALAKWGGATLLQRLAEQDRRMADFQAEVASMGAELKAVLTAETRVIREVLSNHQERIGRLETFVDLMHPKHRNHHAMDEDR